jgi:hypothetical protein
LRPNRRRERERGDYRHTSQKMFHVCDPLSSPQLEIASRTIGVAPVWVGVYPRTPYGVRNSFCGVGRDYRPLDGRCPCNWVPRAGAGASVGAMGLSNCSRESSCWLS